MPTWTKKRASSDSWVNALSADRPVHAAADARGHMRERPVPPPPPRVRPLAPAVYREVNVHRIPTPVPIARKEPPPRPVVARSQGAAALARQPEPNWHEHSQVHALSPHRIELPSLELELEDSDETTQGRIRPLDLHAVRKQLGMTDQPEDVLRGAETPRLFVLEDDLVQDGRVGRRRAHGASRWLARGLGAIIVVLGIVVVDPVDDARQAHRVGRDAVLTVQLEADQAARDFRKHPTTQQVLARAEALLDRATARARDE